MLSVMLTSETEDFIKEQVQGGSFVSPDAFLEASVQLYREQYAKLAELRHLMQEAREDMEQGRYTVCSTEEELAAFTQQVIQRGQERLRQASAQ
jgi:putative addiction module CopG family antidote